MDRWLTVGGAHVRGLVADPSTADESLYLRVLLLFCMYPPLTFSLVASLLGFVSSLLLLCKPAHRSLAVYLVTSRSFGTTNHIPSTFPPITSRHEPSSSTDTKSRRLHSRACLGIVQHHRTTQAAIGSTPFAEDLNYRTTIHACIAHGSQRTTTTPKNTK